MINWNPQDLSNSCQLHLQNCEKQREAIYCSNHHELISQLPLIQLYIETYGFCVVKAWDNSITSLKQVSCLFGNLQLHIRSDQEGVVGGNDNISKTWLDYKQEYRGITNDEFHPHTDGTFVQGLISGKQSAFKVNPPKMLLLQCVRKAKNGGTNILVDSKPILYEINQQNPQMFDILSSPGCITYCRDDQLAIDIAVYRRVKENLYYIRFRYDAATYTPSWSRAAVESLHYDYHLNEKYQTRVDLQQNDILIIDNLRVLHGREAFASDHHQEVRKLRRTWIAHEADELYNVVDYHREQRAFLPYENYKTLTQATDSAFTNLKLGIQLDKSTH